jgi:catechol 2,3-dioxygenase-like lactoylglutathione lyase family enzyme
MIEANAGNSEWRIPSERELAEELQVSRPVVREAVIALEMRGIVEVKGRAGIVILPARASQLNFDRIGADIGPGPFELLEARLAVESSGAAMAAERATSYDILDAGGGMLEIFAPADGAARAVDVPEGTSGLRHLTFLFENIDETFAKLEKAGVELKERPRLAVNREVLHKVAFVRDPDGILIELAERLP